MYQFRQYFAYKWPQNSKISILLAAFCLYWKSPQLGVDKIFIFEYVEKQIAKYENVMQSNTLVT